MQLTGSAAAGYARTSSPAALPPAVVTAAPTTTSASAAPAKCVYQVEGNYRATQLHHTDSNGDGIN